MPTLIQSKAQIELLKKYLISTLLFGAVFGLVSWLLPVRIDLSPAQRYFIPILISGALVFFFYFKRLSGYKRRKNWPLGGKFYVVAFYMSGIFMTSLVWVSIVDEATQKVAEIETIDKISDDSPEYIHIKKFTPNLDVYTYEYWGSAGKIRNNRRTNYFEFTAYVPLVLDPQDTVYKTWIVLKQFAHKDGILTKDEWSRFEDNFRKVSQAKTEQFDFGSIVFFRREKKSYDELPGKSNAPFKGDVLLLTPSNEPLSYEVQSDLIKFLAFYAGIFLFYLYAVGSIDKPKPMEVEGPQVKSP